MTWRRPKVATWIRTRSPPSRCTNPPTTSAARTQTAWRERPPRWSRAWQARGAKLVVAHDTVLRLTTSPGGVALVWRHKTPPDGPFGNSQHRLKLAKAV